MTHALALLAVLASAPSVKVPASPAQLNPASVNYSCTVVSVSSVGQEGGEIAHHVWTEPDGISDVGKAVGVAVRRTNGQVTALRVDGHARPSFAFTAISGRDGVFVASDANVISAVKVDDFADVATSTTPARTFVLSMRTGVGIVTETVGETAWTYALQCR